MLSTSSTGGKGRGCANCRTRKIKCDRSEPACNHCVKSGWVCPGYTSKDQWVFRNQTISVASKLRPTLSPSTSDQATAFFISQYVFSRPSANPLHPPSRGHYEYIPALLQGESSDSVLATTVAAVGLASLANAGNSNSWRVAAFKLHGLALRRLKDAVEVEGKATEDKTLAAIVLMGTFEQIASADVNSMEAFSKHIMAVAKFIEFRGPSQFRTPISAGLLHEIRRLVIMTLHRLQAPVPPALSNWTLWTGKSFSEDEAPAISFSSISMELVGARAEIKQKGVLDPVVVATMLLPIDEKLEKWRSELPASWQYKSYTALDPITSSSNTYDSRYDVYADLWIASIWNSYRTSRLLLHEHIMSMVIKFGTAQDKGMLQTAAKVLKIMVDEICHSVPFHLGVQRRGNSCRFEYSEAIPASYLLIWPLFASGMRRTTPWPQKEWISGKLRFIGTKMGLRLALSMAGRLMMERRPSSGADIWVMGEWYPK